jgi:SAM-dependent methyltransferase
MDPRAVHDAREELDTSLSAISDLERIASNLTPEERLACASLAVDISHEANVFCKEYFSRIGHRFGASDPYGIECATSPERNYLFAILTANATKESRKILGRRPTVVDLGMGSGLNCLAALFVDPHADVVGVEQNSQSVAFAEKMFAQYGFSGNVDVLPGDFTKTKLKGLNFDVVVNENFDPTLVNEPQFLAMNAVLPATHPQTIFVPAGIDVFAEGFGLHPKYPFFGSIELNQKEQSPIVLSHTFKPGELHSRSQLIRTIAQLRDFQGAHAVKLSERREIDYLLLRSPILVVSELMNLNPSVSQDMELELYFDPSIDKGVHRRCVVYPTSQRERYAFKRERTLTRV